MNQSQYDLDRLALLSELPRRTVRYYIQEGLVDRPEGAGRGSHYTQRHLEQLLEIRKLQRLGLSLERIRELLEDKEHDTLPVTRSRAGSVEVWSHLTIADGLELHVEPSRAGLTPEELRRFLKRVTELYSETIQEDK